MVSRQWLLEPEWFCPLRPEAEIRKLRGDPVKLMCEAARAYKNDRHLLDTVALMIAERFRNWGMATHRDYAEFLDTPRGQAFSVWYAIKHNDNAPSIPEIEFWMGELANEFEEVPVINSETELPETDAKGEPVTEIVNTGWKKIREMMIQQEKEGYKAGVK